MDAAIDGPMIASLIAYMIAYLIAAMVASMTAYGRDHTRAHESQSVYGVEIKRLDNCFVRRSLTTGVDR